MRYILRFPKAIVQANQTGQFTVLAEVSLVGPYALHARAWTNDGTRVDLYVEELRIGPQIVLKNLWAREAQRALVDEHFVLLPGTQVLVRVRNPYRFDVDGTLLFSGHQREISPPVEPRPIAEVLDERLNETRRKLKKIAGLPVATTMGAQGGVGGAGFDPRGYRGSGQHQSTTLTGSGGGGGSGADYDGFHYVGGGGGYGGGYSNTEAVGSGGGASGPTPPIEPEPLPVEPEPLPVEPEPLRVEEPLAARERTRAESRAHALRRVEATLSGMTDAERLALHAYNRDVDASLARQLELLRPIDETEDAAWESPTDEWP